MSSDFAPDRAPMDAPFSGRRRDSRALSELELDMQRQRSAQSQQRAAMNRGSMSLPGTQPSPLRNNHYDSLVSRQTYQNSLAGSLPASPSIGTRAASPHAGGGSVRGQLSQHQYGSAVIRRQQLTDPYFEHDHDETTEAPQEEPQAGVCDCVYQRLFGDLGDAEDDFDTILRKIVVTVGVPLVVFPLTFAVYMATEVAIRGATAGAITTLIVMFVFPMVWIPSYIYVRQTKETPDALVDAWLIITIISVGIMALSLVEYPVSSLAFYLATIAIMCHTRLMWFELLLAAIVYMLNAANFTFLSGGEPDADLLALPDPYRGSILERAAYQGSCFVIGLIIISALLMQMREHVRQIAAAREAAEMSRKVAVELQRYDTEAVQVTLDQYSRHGLADSHLIETFSAIVDNLELFRPHLPNWMLNALVGGGDDDPDLAGDVPTTISRSNSMVSMQSMRLEGSRGRNGSTVGAWRDVAPDNMSDGTGSEFSVRGNYRNEGDKLVKGQRRSFLKKTAENPAVSSVGPKPHNGKVTYAMLEVVTADDLGLKRYESIGSRFVDRVHQAAAETHAAVHTFVGDTVHASWNTAGRIALPEVKACRFVAQILKDSGDSSVTVQGCVMTGEGRSYLAGTKQQALTVSIKWRDALHAAVIHSRKHSAVYLCAETHNSAKAEMVTRGVDAIRVRFSRDRGSMFFGEENYAAFNDDDASPTSGGTSSPSQSPMLGRRRSTLRGFKGSRVVRLYQLFKERDEVELSADEWMYVVDATEHSTVQQDTVLTKCLKGDYAGALSDVNEALKLLRMKAKAAEAASTSQNMADLEEATWVDDDEDDEDVDLEDPVARALLHLKRRADDALRDNTPADQFPVDMTEYF